MQLPCKLYVSRNDNMYKRCIMMDKAVNEIILGQIRLSMAENWLTIQFQCHNQLQIVPATVWQDLDHIKTSKISQDVHCQNNNSVKWVQNMCWNGIRRKTRKANLSYGRSWSLGSDISSFIHFRSQLKKFENWKKTQHQKFKTRNIQIQEDCPLTYFAQFSRVP